MADLKETQGVASSNLGAPTNFHGYNLLTAPLLKVLTTLPHPFISASKSPQLLTLTPACLWG